MYGGQHDRLDAADGFLHGGEVAFTDAAIIREGYFFHDAAEGFGHFADAVPEDAGTDADHMIAGFQAAFQRAPEGEHTFAGHQDDIVLCAHELADAAAGGVVKAQEIGFDLPRSVIPAENGNDVFVQGDRAGDHGNGGVTHDGFLCVGVSAASGRGTFSRSTSRTSLSVMVMLRNRLPVRVNRCGSSVMKKRMRPVRPGLRVGQPFVGEAALDHLRPWSPRNPRYGLPVRRPCGWRRRAWDSACSRAQGSLALETSQTAAQGSVKPRLRRWGRRTSLLRPAARTAGKRGCGPALRGGGGGWLRHRPRCGWWIRWR